MAAVAITTFWDIRQKIYRFLNFNMVFQLVLTIFFKSELFSCLPKFITWPTDAKDLLPLGKFWNGCFSFNIGPIKTKLKNVANLNVLFLRVFFYPIKKDSYPAPLGLKLGNARLGVDHLIFDGGDCRIFRLLDIFFYCSSPAGFFFKSPCPCLIFFLMEI